MANVHGYLYCLAILYFAVANGQYYHPKDYLKSSVLSPTSLKKGYLVDEALGHVEAVSRNTIFQDLVAEILDVADGDLGNVLELNLPGNVSAPCRTDFNQFMMNISETYALHMLDAAGKLPSGLYQGNVLWLGRYDQCLSIKADKTHDFNGRYCLTRLISYKPKALFPEVVFQIRVAAKMWIRYFYQMHLVRLGIADCCGIVLETIKYVLKVMQQPDDSINEPNMLQDGREESGPKTMNGSVISSIPNENVVDVIDTINLVDDRTNGSRVNKQLVMTWAEKILLCFSPLTNGKKLLATQSAGPNSHLAALNGIRVISMFWVILGHTHLFISTAVDNGLQTYDIIKRFSFQAIINGTFSVDTFFVLSGLLVCYFALKELKANDGRLNWALFYFHRFWRLTPVYMLVILIWTTLTPHFTNGPQYFTLYTDLPGQPALSPVSTCKKYWWTNLLYINNLYPTHLKDECLGWSWYLANDMQFYVISPIIIYLLYRYAYVGFAVIGSLMAACFTSIAVISWKYDLSPGAIQPNFHNSTNANADDLVYIKPWIRINSYLVGMVTGYALYLLQGRKWRMPKGVNILGWCCAIGTGVGIVYGLHGTYLGRYQTQGAAVFYFTVSRYLWSSAVAWVAFACVTGYGGPVNSLLGWTAWGPLARLTYCAYLVHPIIIYVYFFSAVTPFHYTDYTMIYMYIGNLVLSYAVAFVVSVCLEAPFMGLEKLLLPKRGAQYKEKNQKPGQHSES